MSGGVYVPILSPGELEAVCAVPNDTPHDDISLLDLRLLPEHSWKVNGDPFWKSLRINQ
jgi:hypothetical protein